MDLNNPANWNPPDYNAVNVWLCGRCSTELLASNNCLTCEVCGSRYELDTGTPLHLVDAVPPTRED